MQKSILSDETIKKISKFLKYFEKVFITLLFLILLIKLIFFS